MAPSFTLLLYVPCCSKKFENYKVLIKVCFTGTLHLNPLIPGAVL